MFLQHVVMDEILSEHIRFRHLKSTQILNRPDGFGTTTMPEHHGNGWVTGNITPSDSICLVLYCVEVMVHIWLCKEKMA